MRANVYVDGFNLYYGALESTPYKWLNLAALRGLLLKGDTVNRIRYFTARVQAEPRDPDKGVEPGCRTWRVLGQQKGCFPVQKRPLRR